MYTLVSVQMYFICLQDTNRIGHNSSYSYVFSCIGSVIVINPTFNNISVRSWRSVLLVEETGVPGENHRPVVSHWQTLSYNVVSSLDYKISNIIKKKYSCVFWGNVNNVNIPQRFPCRRRVKSLKCYSLSLCPPTILVTRVTNNKLFIWWIPGLM
jgi:hypothetical protein